MIYEKIAPGLMSVLEDFQEAGHAGLVPHMRSLGVIAAARSPKPPRAVVFIHCQPDADLSHLEEAGIRVNQSTGPVRTAFLPLHSLDALSEDPAVHRIIPSRYMHLKMDIASSKVHLPDFRQQYGLSGKGVIIGIVDSGIDPKHPAFQGRILRIWDQTLPGPGVLEGGYGVELSGPLTVVSRDFDGHGTHVAGIAAGNDATYSGVAPEADLLIVKSDLQDAHIADAILYIFRIADEMNRPAVINLSLGGHGDAHDGSDSLSMIIDAVSGPGRIVCCAAGNEGNVDIHAQARVRQRGQRTIRFHVPASSGPDAIRVVGLNGWYSGQDEIELAVISPNGFITDYQRVIPSGNPMRTYPLPDGLVRIFTPGPDPANGDHNFFVEIRGPVGASAPVTPGAWRVRLRGRRIVNGRVDVWTLDNSVHLDVRFGGRYVEDSVKIGSPGAAHRAITVAAYTTRTTWTDADGVPRAVGLDLDDISDFSSEGPLRDGTEKPDLAAPGAMIVSALSADSAPLPTNVVDAHHVVMAGTSMATPFVTGVVALLLERDPTLDPDQVKALLRQHCKIPRRPQGTFHAKWGYGLLDLAGL
ncbi:MAG: hypothetical protein Kow0047_34720 [Anaerolineae bacterium]